MFNHAQKGMIGRWYAQLAAYDLDITYASGKSQVTADPLSRILTAQLRTPTSENVAEPESVTKVLGRVATLLRPPEAWTQETQTEQAWISVLPGSLKCPDKEAWDGVRKFLARQFTGAHLARSLPREVWASHQRQDPVLGPIYAYLSSTAKSPPSAGSAKLRAAAQSYRLVEGLHYRSIRDIGVRPLRDGWVVAVPESLQLKVIKECHSDGCHGHTGVIKTVWAIRKKYFFRKMRAVVARYVVKCSSCIRANSFEAKKDLPLESMVASEPFQAISVDLYSPGEVLESGNKYVLTVVDLFSRWVQFVPLKSKLPSEVVTALCRTWFHFHGIPKYILSDRGKEFMGVMSTVCKLLGVHTADQDHSSPSPDQWSLRGPTQDAHQGATHPLGPRVLANLGGSTDGNPIRNQHKSGSH